MARRFHLIIPIALLFLAYGYWGRWISHPAASLNILGVDLAEYVKFVPEARYGVISINRLFFFASPVSLALGLILFASLRSPIKVWLRVMAGLLVIPTSLSMLPPAWTPGLLMSPEFRTQTLLILALLGIMVLIPLWKYLLPDWLRGGLLIILGLLPFLALSSFFRIMPALARLYHRPLHPAAGVYALMIGMTLITLSGLLMLYAALKERYISSQD